MHHLKKAVKTIVIALVVMAIGAVLNHYCVKYDSQRAARFITKYSLDKSHESCAGWVMAAIIAGGEPCILLRGCDYEYLLPLIGFEEIVTDGTQDRDNYKGQVGDIVVFPAKGKHIFGHIAMWNGERWISDFKQKHFFCATAYRKTPYKIFRHK